MRERVTRRDLLKAGAAAGAAAGMLGGIDPMLEQVLAAPRRRGRLKDIEHVVVLMQENRSFDHYFGTFPGVRGFADAPASVLAQPGYPQPGFGGRLLPFHLPGGVAGQCFPDITHSWAPQHQSWNGGRMDQFVATHVRVDGASAGPATMGYYTRQDIPFYWALAKAFTICDRYHCSVIGPTDPNRMYSISATLDPDGRNGGPLVETIVTNRAVPDRSKFFGRFTWTTMPEQLSARGISWKVYSEGPSGALDNMLVYFKNFQGGALKTRGIDPQYPADFLADVRQGTLPAVSWLNPSVSASEHPGYSFARIGEHVTRTVVEALMSNRKLWEKTALFVTWDENGGFFDHVAPPVAPAGTAGEYLTAPDVTGQSQGITGPIGLGFRVPMLIVSPFTRGGFVSSQTFDHTSVLRFLETRFGAEVPNLSGWRRSVTGDLTSAFNFAKPDARRPRLPPVTLTQQACPSSPAPVPVPANSKPRQPHRRPRRPSGNR